MAQTQTGRIRALLEAEPDRVFTPADVATELSFSDPQRVSVVLANMTRRGGLTRVGKGRYQANPATSVAEPSTTAGGRKTSRRSSRSGTGAATTRTRRSTPAAQAGAGRDAAGAVPGGFTVVGAVRDGSVVLEGADGSLWVARPFTS